MSGGVGGRRFEPVPDPINEIHFSEEQSNLFRCGIKRSGSLLEKDPAGGDEVNQLFEVVPVSG